MFSRPRFNHTRPNLGPQNFSEVFPHLIAASDVGALVKISDVDFDKIDAVFCCLPHATTQQIIKELPRHLKIVDLSADFRLRDVNTYAEWCGACGGGLQLDRLPHAGTTCVLRAAGPSHPLLGSQSGARLVSPGRCSKRCGFNQLGPAAAGMHRRRPPS